MKTSPDASGEFPILRLLRADGPHPELAEELMVFGRFVGSWQMNVEFFDDAGTCVYREPGEWSFAWVLDGRAIQDVLTYPRLDNAAPTRGIGTSLRFFDRQAEKWEVIWLGAVTGITVVLWGGPVDNEIWLEGPDPDGTLNRWMFTDITTDSFTWRGLESADAGVSWRLRQKMSATRTQPG